MNESKTHKESVICLFSHLEFQVFRGECVCRFVWWRMGEYECVCFIWKMREPGMTMIWWVEVCEWVARVAVHRGWTHLNSSITECIIQKAVLYWEGHLPYKIDMNLPCEEKNSLVLTLQTRLGNIFYSRSYCVEISYLQLWAFGFISEGLLW